MPASAYFLRSHEHEEERMTRRRRPRRLRTVRARLRLSRASPSKPTRPRPAARASRQPTASPRHAGLTSAVRRRTPATASRRHPRQAAGRHGRSPAQPQHHSARPLGPATKHAAPLGERTAAAGSRWAQTEHGANGHAQRHNGRTAAATASATPPRQRNGSASSRTASSHGTDVQAGSGLGTAQWPCATAPEDRQAGANGRSNEPLKRPGSAPRSARTLAHEAARRRQPQAGTHGRRKAGNSKRYGFTARPKAETKKRG